MYALRYAGSEDAPLLAALRAELIDELTGGGTEEHRLQLDARALAHEMDAGRLAAWVAVDGRGNAAACLLMAFAVRPPRLWDSGGLHAYVAGVYTRPGHRRLGLAARLVNSAVDHCRLAGVQDISLHATDKGRELFAGLGFSGFEPDAAWTPGKAPGRAADDSRDEDELPWLGADAGMALPA
ncbi:MAG: GNAT family N-acetyltransferase [Desulfovibrionaceae bacterium]|jgi:GNAT superfamily N-acetyltransferase|nr:GNAT family N-acetyltransferase [Desulfovibrionaceae bacterium]